MDHFSFGDIQATDGRGGRLAAVPDEARLRQTVVSILDECVLCSIATVTADGRPHINIAYFSYSDALAFYFLSHPDSLHCRNLSRNPSIAASVFAPTHKWAEGDRGLQLFGTCAAVREDSEAAAERSYATRFEGYAGWRATLKAGDPGCEYRFYRVLVESVKVLDETTLGDGVLVQAAVVRP